MSISLNGDGIISGVSTLTNPSEITVGTGASVFSPASNELALGTNGSERVRIDSSGNFGLGTNSPATLFEAKSTTTNLARIRVSGTSATAGNFRGYEFSNGSVFKGGFLQDESTDLISIFTPVGGQSVNITSAGLVAIGTTDPAKALEVRTASGIGQIRVGRSTGSTFNYDIGRDNDATGFLYFYGNQTGATGFVFSGVDGERARIDNNGRLLVGASSASYSTRAVFQGNSAGSGFGAKVHLALDANGQSLSSGNNVGGLLFSNNAGDQFASIVCDADGTTGSGDYPGRLVFSTTADGASSPTERMRITSGGTVYIGANPANGAFSNTGFLVGANGIVNNTTSGSRVAFFNRLTDDGTIIEIAQDTAVEGTISVSGTTVSYNGAHLSRWSQLPGGVERIEILRGTVLSNTDEMCAWGDEDNEQLNRMQVSDIEGDPNVAGVFQAWDDDDDTYTDDFYCAMTGDFIIRIAEGVTVQRGDLLMSAGDGTAKPQEDDIVRSKTVAKVTSTHVTCTYEDGSYCVPCVLMAC